MKKSGKNGSSVKMHLTQNGKLAKVRWLVRGSERVYFVVSFMLMCVWPNGKESENVRRVGQDRLSRSRICDVSHSLFSREV